MITGVRVIDGETVYHDRGDYGLAMVADEDGYGVGLSPLERQAEIAPLAGTVLAARFTPGTTRAEAEQLVLLMMDRIDHWVMLWSPQPPPQPPTFPSVVGLKVARKTA